MFRDRDQSVASDSVISSRAIAGAKLNLPRVSPADVAEAEAAKKFVAIYVVWVKDEKGFMLGTTTSDNAIPSGAERFNKKDIDYVLLWTMGGKLANHVLSLIEPELIDYHKHGQWYDDMPAKMILKTIEMTAKGTGVKLFSTAERDRLKAEGEVVDYSTKQKALEAAKSPAATRGADPPASPHGAKVVQLIPRKK